MSFVLLGKKINRQPTKLIR